MKNHMRNPIPYLSLVLLALIASPSMAQSVIIKAGTIHTMAGDPISPGQILIVDGEIEAIAKTIAGSPEADVLDYGPDSVVLPGFIDAYSQVGLLSGSSDEITKEVTPTFLAAKAIDWSRKDLRRQLERGTTTMNLCPGTQNVIGGISAIIKTDPEAKSVLVKQGPLVGCMCSDPAARNFSRTRPDSIYVRQPTNRMGVVWILRNTFAKTVNAQQNSKLKRDSELLPIANALRGSRKFMLVSRMSFDLNTIGTLADEFGFSPIIVGGEEAYKIKSIVKKRNYPIVLRPHLPGQVQGSEGAELCWNTPGILEQEKIAFAFSGNDLLQQAQFAHRNGCSREKALEALTTAPAKILGIDKHVGSIAPGKNGDLVILNGDPLEFTTSVESVVINGKVIDN